jgi:hypothetical protein
MRHGFAIASSQLTRNFSVDCAPNAPDIRVCGTQFIGPESRGDMIWRTAVSRIRVCAQTTKIALNADAFEWWGAEK